MNRTAFWNYSNRTARAIKGRSVKLGLPCDVDRYYIDALFVDQAYRCAICLIPFDQTNSIDDRQPFSPSLDRIKPELGYTKGNVRLVAAMVNFAMSNWGEENLFRLVAAMSIIGTGKERKRVTSRALQKIPQRFQHSNALIPSVTPSKNKGLQQ